MSKIDIQLVDYLCYWYLDFCVNHPLCFHPDSREIENRNVVELNEPSNVPLNLIGWFPIDIWIERLAERNVICKTFQFKNVCWQILNISEWNWSEINHKERRCKWPSANSPLKKIWLNQVGRNVEDIHFGQYGLPMMGNRIEEM